MLYRETNQIIIAHFLFFQLKLHVKHVLFFESENIYKFKYELKCRHRKCKKIHARYFYINVVPRNDNQVIIVDSVFQLKF